jgi:L-glutamine-phosphate cytidylyltransferase
MKGIVIAAGKGSRLGRFTITTPKPLVKVQEKCFFDNTVENLRALGVNEIATVVGYKKNQFKVFKDITFFENNDWENNNILQSLFYARDFMDDDLIIVYGDIWFEEKSFRNIYTSTGDFVIAVDKDWEDYYQGRTDHPISEAENVIYDDNLHAIQIGKHISPSEGGKQCIGEFMGLIKISRNIIKDIVSEFENIESDIRSTDSFQNAKMFKDAYLTDFIQYLINKGYEINCCINSKGWYEVDTEQDLENLRINLQKG